MQRRGRRAVPRPPRSPVDGEPVAAKRLVTPWTDRGVLGTASAPFLLCCWSPWRMTRAASVTANSLASTAWARAAASAANRSSGAERVTVLVVGGGRPAAGQSSGEEHHVGVAASCRGAGGEVDGRDAAAFDGLGVGVAVGLDVAQRLRAEGRGAEPDPKEAVVGGDAAEHAEHRLRHQRRRLPAGQDGAQHAGHVEQDPLGGRPVVVGIDAPHLRRAAAIVSTTGASRLAL